MIKALKILIDSWEEIIPTMIVLVIASAIFLPGWSIWISIILSIPIGIYMHKDFKKPITRERVKKEDDSDKLFTFK